MEMKFKRFLSFALAVLMVVSYVPVNAFATEGSEDVCEHTYDNNCDFDCNGCGEYRNAPHNLTTHEEAEVPANCQETGHPEYWVCADCGGYFGDANASNQLNPDWMNYTGDCVRPEDVADCAVVECEKCGEDTYGDGEHDVLACQDGTCSKCGAEVTGYGCVNYDTPACEDGVCYYCGDFVAGKGHENGAWAPCLDGVCSYGCGLTYPATAEHTDEDGNDYCDICWTHLNHDVDPCAGGYCQVCWNYIEPAHSYENGYCTVCDGEDPSVTFVAQVGETKYESLAEAVAAAESGATVTLLGDATGAGVVINKDITIDFGGYTYTVNYAVGSTGTETLGFQILAGSNAVPYNVTLKNGTIAVVEVPAEGSKEIKVVVMNYSNLTVENLTIDGTGNTEMLYGLATNNGTVELKGDTSVAVPSSATAAIDVDGAQAAYGDAKITINTTGTITGKVDIYGAEASAEIKAGTINGEISNADGVSSLTVSGGSFTADVSGYLASGASVTVNGETVVKNTDGTVVTSPVAVVNGTYYGTLANAVTAAVAGDEVVIVEAGTYSVPTGKSITITGAVKGVEFSNIGACNMGGASVTFNNVTFVYAMESYYQGLTTCGTMVYNNCTFNGQVFLYGTSETFNNCTFNQTSSDAYNVWTYGAKEVTFNGCTFNSAGKSVLVYNEGYCATDLTVENTTFIASTVVEDKAAIEIDTSLMPKGTEIVVDAATTATGFGTETLSGSSLWNDKKATGGERTTTSTVTVAGEVVKKPAPEGTITICYTDPTRFWGEATSNSYDSFVVELYDGDDKIASASLNDYNNIIDGNIENVTWGIPFNGADSEYWNVEWAEGYPNASMTPDKVVLVSDGVKVAENVVQLNWPDGLYKIVAQITDSEGNFKGYATSLETAVAGDVITLLSDVSGNVTLPAGVTLNGNGYAINGTVTATAGDLTIKGYTKVTKLSLGSGNTITIGEGATLEITGTDRLVIGWGNTFNITGTIADAKTADTSSITPSLIVAKGASITGSGVTFNVTNAYIKFNAYCSSKNTTASGTFNFNVTNSIWDQTGSLVFSEPTNSMDPTFNFNLKDSVLNSTSHLVFAVTKGEIVIDNSNVNVENAQQVENRSTMTVKNGSVVYAKNATSSNAKNPGTLIVENATYIGSGEFSGADVGIGTLIVEDGAKVTLGTITKADVTVNGGELTFTKLTVNANNSLVVNGGSVAGEIVAEEGANIEIYGGTFTQNVSEWCAYGYIAVENGDGTYTVKVEFDAKIRRGKVWKQYSTLAQAIADANADETIVLNGNVNANELDISEDITIDLDGFTLFLTTGGNNIYGDVTITNGTVNVSGVTASGDCIIGIGDYSKNGILTLDGVDVVGNGYSSAYAVFYVYNTSTLNIVDSNVTLSNDTASAGGFIKAQSAANGIVNITDSVISLTDAKIGFLDGTVKLDGVELTIKGGANAINQSVLTVVDSTITIDGADGRAITLSQGDVTIQNSTLNLSNCSEGEIRFKKGLTLSIDETSTISDCTVYADASAIDVANVNGDAINGTEANKAQIVNGAVVNPNWAVILTNGDSTYYTMSLADALAKVETGENVINLYADCAEDVTVSETAGVNILIEGNWNNYSGTITIQGNSTYGAETLTIQHINFVTDEASHYFVQSNSQTAPIRYANNVTVQNCTFTATGAGYKTAAALDFRQAKNIAMIDCTVTGMHSAVQSKGGTDLTVTGVTTVDCKNGISVGTTDNVTISNVNIEADGYGVRADASAVTNVAVTGSTITAEKPVIVRNATADGFELTVGKGNALTSTTEGGDQIIVTAGDDGTTINPSVPVKVTGAENLLVFPVSYYVAKIGDLGYLSLADAITAAKNDVGTNIVLVADLDELDVDLSGLTLDLNGHTVTATRATVYGENIAIKNGVVNGTLMIGGNNRADGAQITGVKATAIYSYNTKDVVLTDCEAETVTAARGTQKMCITSGTYGTVVVYAGDGMMEIGAELTISGGTYGHDVTEWCAEGLAAIENWDGTFTVGPAPGTQGNPIMLLELENTVENEGTTWYCGYFNGTTMTVTGEDTFSVIYDSTTMQSSNGTVSMAVSSSNPRMPVTFAISGTGTYQVNFVYPAGSQMNPAVADLGDNEASIEAGSEGYYFTYIADYTGELVVTISTDAGWTYIVNNMTTYVYGDTQWSDSDPVVNPATIAVTAGDEIQIIVNTYDPANMWSNPAGDITVNLAYKAGSCPEYAIFLGSMENTVTNAGTMYYMGYFSGTTMTVTGEGEFSVVYNGETIAAVDGVVSVPVSTANPRMPVEFSVLGDGEFTINFAYPAGSQSNPAVAELGDNKASVEAGSEGYYFTYTADYTGELVVTITADTGWTYVVNNMTTYVYGDTQWSDSDPVVNPATIAVTEGDEIQIIVNTYDPENPWTAPAGDITVNLAYKAGSCPEYAIFLGSMENTVTNAGIVYYQGYFSGTIMTVSGEGNFSVLYNDQPTTAVDGVVSIPVSSSNPRMPVEFSVLGDGEFTINFAYPAGSQSNPAVAELGDNKASVEAGSQGYYFTYIADYTGELVVTITADTGWTYVVNNMTTYVYGDAQWSDSDPVVNPATIAVTEGDEIQIIVNTYDPENPWTAPAGEITVNLAYEVERFTLSGANVKLGEALDMFFYVSYANLSGTEYYAEIRRTYADGTEETIKVPYSEWEQYNSTLIRVCYAGLPARAMADELYVTIYSNDGTQVSDVWEDSIKAYTMRQLALDSNASKPKLLTTLVDMLNYGAAAQTYFEYNTGDMANADLTDEQKAYATQTVSCTDNRVKGTNYVGSSLSLTSNLVLTMYFNNLTTDMYAVITYTDHNGNAEELRVAGSDFYKRGDMFGVDVTGMAVADGKQLITCKVYNASDEEVASAVDSVESYVARMSDTNAIYEMVMKFVTSAYNYFEK